MIIVRNISMASNFSMILGSYCKLVVHSVHSSLFISLDDGKIICYNVPFTCAIIISSDV